MTKGDASRRFFFTKASTMDNNSDIENDHESDIEIEIDELTSLDLDDQRSDTDSPSTSTGSTPAPSATAETWSERADNIFISDYTPVSGPQHSLPPSARPIDYFMLMFPLALINTLAEETNRYARQCIAVTPNSTWYDTTLDELRAFLAIQLIFGIRSLPRLWCYWSEDKRYNDPWVSSIMTIARFKNLSRYFHCRDTSSQPQRGDSNFDPLFKVRNVIEETKQTFQQHFTPNRELSLDETMVGFKGRLSFKMYMPKKPTKWELKIWTICDARLGYCLGYDVYTGKHGRRDTSKTLSYEVVDYLCAPHYGKGHHVYFDRFFNGVDVAKQLLANSTYSCGTIMANRRGLPPAMKSKVRKGEIRQHQQGNLVATSFHDKRPVHLLSGNQIMGTGDDGRPFPLVDYNMFMGGVDKLDQHLSYYPVGRPGKKWWRYVVWHLINVSVYNAYVVWSQSVKDYSISKQYDHMMFRMDIAETLVNGFCSRKLPGRPSTKQLVASPQTIKHHRLIRILGRRKVCVLCSKDGKKTEKGYAIQSQYQCSFCEVTLCKNTCFGIYHERGLGISDSR